MRIMPRPHQPRHSLAPRFLSLALLVLQALGATGVALAHAAEQTGGPVSIETRHTAQCVVLHDASRCALCHYAQMRAATMPALRVLPTPSHERDAVLAARSIAHPGEDRPAAPSRGPPPLLS